MESDLPPLDPEAVIEPCAARDALDLIADKWTPLVVYLLAQDRQRYSQLKRRLGGISQKMLTQTLRKLEAARCIERTVHPTVPVTVEYELTPLGRTLVEPLTALLRWAHKNAAECGFAEPGSAELPERATRSKPRASGRGGAESEAEG